MTTQSNLSLLSRTKRRLRDKWERELTRFDGVVAEIMKPFLARIER